MRQKSQNGKNRNKKTERLGNRIPFNWIRGRSATTEEGQLAPKTSEVSEVVERAKSIAAKEMAGTFKPKR